MSPTFFTISENSEEEISLDETVLFSKHQNRNLNHHVNGHQFCNFSVSENRVGETEKEIRRLDNFSVRSHQHFSRLKNYKNR